MTQARETRIISETSIISETKAIVFGAGTRGDVQPLVALALGLQDANYRILFVTSPNHEDFVKSFGLNVAATLINIDAVVREDDGIRQAMETGDATKFFIELDSATMHKRKRACYKGTWRACVDFEPHLVLSNHLSHIFALCLQWRFEIPYIFTQLQTWIPTISYAPFGLPNLPFGGNYTWYRIINELLWRNYYSEVNALQEEVGENFGWICARQWGLDTYGGHDPRARPAPVLIAVSRLLEKPRVDWPGEKFNLYTTGPWAIPTKAQETHSMRPGDKAFGGTGHDALMRFLDSGEPCIYMGWGSMVAVSKEHMTLLAVRTLKTLQKRGLICKGWAGLSIECLAGAEDEMELRAYCKDNVLFVDAAPHAIVFPKCACIVHHGGAGTTFCALKSARPMVITPVWLDQFDFADVVNRLECGFGLQKFCDVSVADLVSAINTCMTEKFKANAVKISNEMEEEADGVANAVGVIDTFMATEVQKGEWKRSYEADKRKYMPKSNHTWWCCASTHDPNEEIVVIAEP